VELYIHKIIGYIIDLKFFKLKGEVIEMKAKKMLVLIGLLCLSNVSARAGWFSGFGNRIANGVVNTIQNNISGKVNRAVDNATDGKVAGKDKRGKQIISSGNTTEQEKETKALATSTEPVSRITARGKALRFSNDYKEFDLGNGYLLNGELIYIKSLEIGQEYMKVEEFLDPGLYVLYVLGTSYAENVSTIKNNQCVLGCGIKPLKAKFANKDGHLSAKDELGDAYLVEVLQNTQGRLEIIMVNSENLRGAGRIELYKVPEGPKWLK